MALFFVLFLVTGRVYFRDILQIDEKQTIGKKTVLLGCSEFFLHAVLSDIC